MTTKYREMVAGVALSASPTSYYTAPALTFGAIHAASANNSTGSPVLVQIYKVPSGGTAGALTRIASKTVGANSTASFPEVVNHKLEPGTQLYADGNGSALNISGIEYTQD